MGFFFRRSVNFGPLRLNLSRSGIGASVGVKGARLTMSSRGATYITVGSHGFYYRERVCAPNTNPPKVGPENLVQDAATIGAISTADVTELIDSSSSELIERLNERAQMFNPAVALYLIGALGAIVGLSIISNGTNIPALPELPNTQVPLDAGRNTNTTDEYALLLARYGNPNKVVLSSVGAVPARTATFEEARVDVMFVPSGCVESYSVYREQQQKAPVIVRRGVRRAPSPKPPPCSGSPTNASTIVQYRDSENGASIEAQSAQQRLDVNIHKSALPPVVVAPVANRDPHQRSVGTELHDRTVPFDQETFTRERNRLESEAAQRKTEKISGTCCLLGGFLSVLIAIPAHVSNRRKRSTELVYELNDPTQQNQILLDRSIDVLAGSHAVWRVISKQATYDWKHNAGAGHLIDRRRINVSSATPPRVKSNVVPKCIDLGAIRLYFLPDFVLYWQSGTFASISYDDISLGSGSTRFIEDEQCPADARQVGSTWRYVRKDGGPDRRFNNNRELPVLLYGVVTITSSKGMNLLLNTSSVDAATGAVGSFHNFQRSRRSNWVGPSIPSPTPKPSVLDRAFGVLGVDKSASADQIAEAYHRLAQMYHPDKVSGLGPELKQVAEERMKEINAAYQLIKKAEGVAAS